MAPLYDILLPKKARNIYHALRFTQVIDSPESAAKFLRKVWDKNLITTQEQFLVIFLNEENVPIDYKCIHTGGGSTVNVDLKILFKEVCNSGCDAIVVAHNHPNGSLKASVNDRKTTVDIQDACRLFRINLNDHIILSSKSYFSFLEAGLLSVCFAIHF